MKNRKGSVRLEVLDPLSKLEASAKNAPRFDSLNGKTICEVWTTGDYGADRTFPVIRELLKKQFPDAKLVPYTEFHTGKVLDWPRWGPLDKVGETLRGKGCDAVLLGNGG